MDLDLKSWIRDYLQNKEDIISYGNVLNLICIKYSGDELRIVRIILRWLRGDKYSPKKTHSCYFKPKKQNGQHRKLYHDVADKLGLNHFTIEITSERYYCKNHKNFCSKYRPSVDIYSKTYDSDHECSDSNFDDRCDPELRVSERRITYIANADIDTEQKLMHFININGDDNKPPFIYTYL